MIIFSEMKDIDLIKELNSISQTHTLQRDDIDGIMIEFAGRITQSLKIERMSVWLFQEDSKEIISMGEYDARTGKFGKDTVVLIFCSASLVSIPSAKAISTDSSKLAGALFLHKLIAADLVCFTAGIASFAD